MDLNTTRTGDEDVLVFNTFDPAMHEGVVSRLQGMDSDTCPYPAGHPDRPSWMEGWGAASGSKVVRQREY